MVLLRKLRTEKGLSMKELGKLTGIKGYVISNLENGQYKTSNSLVNLAKYFNINNPLDLLKSAETTIKSKKCLNQVCLLNKNSYCQSSKVVEGAYCSNQNEVSKKIENVNFNNKQALFIK